MNYQLFIYFFLNLKTYSICGMQTSVFKQMHWNIGHNFIRKASVFNKYNLETRIMVQQKSEQLDVFRGVSGIHTQCNAVPFSRSV